MIELRWSKSIPLDGRVLTPDELQRWRESRQRERDNRAGDEEDWGKILDELGPLPGSVKLICGGCDIDGTWWGPVDSIAGMSIETQKLFAQHEQAEPGNH